MFEKMEAKINNIINENADKKTKLKKICQALKDGIPHYDWVGFYFVKNNNDLILGPFVGEDTEHKKIKFGQGICGQAAQLKKIFVVQDVAKEENYLSCSPKVVSEIVVPIFKDKEIVGEIDIDSHKLSPFTEGDKKFLEKIARMISENDLIL